MKSTLLEVLCFAVLCTTLSLGLWPFHSPENAVTWLQGRNGVVLGKDGTILSSGALNAAESPEEATGSIEIWVQPDRWNGSATFLSLYRPEKNILFTLHQSLTRLNLRTEVKNRKALLQVEEAFGPSLRQKKPVVITVTWGKLGTSVYLNGALARVAPQFSIPVGAFRGRLIVGDSPRQPDSFRGQIRGLAIYELELSVTQVSRHYQTWSQNGRPAIAQNERNIALYLFNENTGKTIHNIAAASGNLYIPERYVVVDKAALEPFWSEFDFSRSYWSGNLKNVVGFIPFGFCFCAYFVIARPVKRPVLLTVMLGTLVSLTIEVLQAFIPMRDSGTTDIFTNTFGTWLGVMCYRIAYPVLIERLPWIGWFAAPGAQITEVLPGSS